MQAHENMMTLIFRNRGTQAGASLHPPSLPSHHDRYSSSGCPVEGRRAQRYFDEWGGVFCCDILAFEMQDRQRVILENQSLLPSFPLRLRFHSRFGLCPRGTRRTSVRSRTKKIRFGPALHDILARLYTKLQDPDYNYVINTAALATRLMNRNCIGISRSGHV